MQILKDIFRNTAIPLLVLLIFSLFDFAPLRESAASIFVRSESISDKQAVAQSIEDCKSSVLDGAAIEWESGRFEYNPSFNLKQCETVKDMDQAISEGRNSLIAYKRKASLYKISNTIMEVSNVIKFIAMALVLILILINTHAHILKGRYGMNLFDIPRRIVSFLQSRAAEQELLRYKKLFDNGLISDEELAEKMKKLKPAILNSR